LTAERDELSGILSRTDKRAQLVAQVEMERKLAKAEERVRKLEGALNFYASKDNRAACLIDRHEFVEKYFKRDYIVDVMETEYCKDNGRRALEALGQEGGA
jgi:hypothetical protein